MSDLIERQAAIDAILDVTGNSSVRELYEHVQEHGLSDMWSGGVSAAIDIIIAVPPVQPEPCEDTISRQMAIAEIARWIGYIDEDMIGRIQIGLNRLPSAQPEKVKCKKCRYVYYDKEFDNYWCNRMSDPFKVEEDGYCKWGK